MCENPFPYKCEECMTCIIEETQVQEMESKTLIDKGEDVCLETYKEFNYD
jgi:hypothetical protein